MSGFEIAGLSLVAIFFTTAQFCWLLKTARAEIRKV